MGWFRDNIISPLFEGFAGDSGREIRDRLQSDKERIAEKIRRSGQVRGNANSTDVYDQAYSGLTDHLAIEHDLLGRYADYEEMDDYPELCTALDIFADDAVQEDTLRNESIWITSEDERIKEIGHELLHGTLRVEEDLWGIARTLCKYGNGFAELLVSKDRGVVGMTFMPPATTRRMEDYDGTLLGFLQDPSGQGMTIDDFKKFTGGDGSLTSDARKLGSVGPDGLATTTYLVPFESWEVIHWRLRGKWMRSQYGHSVLEGARWIFRRMVLLEDAAVLYKLTRAPARYAYYIDTGDLGPTQALAHVAEIKRNHKKKKWVNAQGKLEFKVNPIAVDEDFWVPTKGGKESTRIEVLSGADWQSLEDLRYFRQKLLAAIKIPATYIGMAEGGDDARASLSSQDVRFAKTILRIQREIKNGYRKAFRVHLSALGIDPNSVKWDVEMASPSSIFELAQIEVRNAQADLAARMADYASRDWIMQHIFDFSADEAAEMVVKQQDDLEDKMVHQAEIQKRTAGIVGVDGMGTPPLPTALPGAPEGVPNPESSKEVGTGSKEPSPGKGVPGDDRDQDESVAALRRSVARRRSGLGISDLSDADIDMWVASMPWKK